MQRDSLTKFNSTPKFERYQKEKKYHLEKCIQFNRPMIVGYMSVDVQRDYHHNLSQLKYITAIPEGRLHFDLNHNIEKAVKRTTDDNDERISLLLKFLLDQKEHLKSLLTGDVLFITYRRVLMDVMCNIFHHKPVTIIGSLLRNCIYFHLVDTAEEERKASGYCKEQDKFCAWGYKFEQYMTADAPDIQPDIDQPVIENAEFSLFYYSQLGVHRLFYGAQIDGMLATHGSVEQVPKTDDVNVNLNFLKKNRFAELKTNKELMYNKQEFNYKKFKLLRCWCQCYLADLKGLLVGYRTDDGIIQRLEWFDTAGIESYCTREWNPQTTVSYLDSFLNFVKESFKSFKSRKETSGEKYDRRNPITLKFDIDAQHKFFVSETQEDSHKILPNWYLDNMSW